MKKLLHISLLMIMSVVVLTGCGKKEKVKEEVKTQPVVEAVQDVVEDIAGGEDTAEASAFDQYQLDISIVSTDADGLEYGVITKMFKKGDKALYQIEEMTGPQELPFTPTKNLLIGTDLYSHIEMDGEGMWFKAEGVEDQANTMFDLEDMQSFMTEDGAVKEQKTETIDGVEMDCYYLVASDGKACMVDGIFAYGEESDPTSGMSSVIKVSNYSDTVTDESVFTVPTGDDVKDISEFMQMMMAKIEAETPPTDTAPVEPAVVE